MSGFTLSPGRRGSKRSAWRPVPTAADRVRLGMRVTLRLASGREAGESVPFQGVEAEIVNIEP